MAVFEKDILYAGKVKPPDRAETVEFTQEDLPDGFTDDGKRISIPFLERRAREMLADNLQIPVAWEHQEKASPLTPEQRAERKAELVKLTLGHVTEIKTDPAGFLTAKLDVPSEDDAKRLPSARFISPEVKFDIEDGRGKKWPGPSITHLAATPRPVQHKQNPFRPVKMSALRLSLADYQTGMDMGTPDVTPSQTPADDRIAKLLDCLGKLGLMLPPDTTPDNILDRLYTAALTLEAQMNPTPQPKETDANLPAGVALSMQQQLDEFKAANALLKAQNDQLVAGRIEDKRRGLASRVDGLFTSGRISKVLSDKLKADLKTVSLSLASDGNLSENALSIKIEAYEELPPDTAWPASAAGGPAEREVRLSMDQYGKKPPETKAEIDAAVKEFAALTGNTNGYL